MSSTGVIGEAVVGGAMARVALADPACLDRDDLAALVRDCGRVRSFVDALEARIVLRAAELAESGRSEPPAELVTDGGRRSTRDARAVDRRAGVCARLPDVHDALAAGSISAGHVDAIARASRALSDAERSTFDQRSPDLLAVARSMPVAEFERVCAATAREAMADDGVGEAERLRHQRSITRWRDAESGMMNTRIALDPLTDETMWGAVNAAVRAAVARGGDDDRSWEHTVVDTFVDLVTRRPPAVAPAPPPTPSTAATLFGEAATSPSSSDRDLPTSVRHVGEGSPAVLPGVAGRVTEVCVLVDWSALRAGAVAAGVLCETSAGEPVPIATVRRLCCDADLYPVVLGAAGGVLDVGRGRRLSTATQRRALAAMYATCAVPRCTVPFADCQVHHVTDWTRHRGRTDLHNLVPLCTRHHHHVHEGGWRLELDADRTITLTRPDGQQHCRGPSPNRRARPTDPPPTRLAAG